MIWREGFHPCLFTLFGFKSTANSLKRVCVCVGGRYSWYWTRTKGLLRIWCYGCFMQVKFYTHSHCPLNSTAFRRLCRSYFDDPFFNKSAHVGQCFPFTFWWSAVLNQLSACRPPELPPSAHCYIGYASVFILKPDKSHVSTENNSWLKLKTKQKSMCIPRHHGHYET